MALTKKTESNVVYLEVKHYCLWRGLKKEVAGCDVVEANNPATGGKVIKYGYKFGTVTGNVTKIVKYDTEKKYSKRYFGFKISLLDGAETFVLDMPYNSQILRRFLHIAPNVDFTVPLSITIFKGKKKDGAKAAGADPTGIWFHQLGETIKPYYTRENAQGMPESTFDDDRQEWDFRAQHRWLIERLKEDTIPAVEAAAQRDVSNPPEGAFGDPDSAQPEVSPDGHWEPTEDDVPF